MDTPLLLPLGKHRQVECGIYGPEKGEPVFYFHGIPGSHHDVQMVEEALPRHGVRVIAPNRPGIGRSTHVRGRCVGAWAQDVEHIANELGIRDFSVLGVSGGGPYAAACAHFLPHRLKIAGIFNGMSPLNIAGASEGMRPFNRLFLEAARRWEPLAHMGIHFLIQRFRSDWKRCLATIHTGANSSDFEVLAGEKIRQSLRQSIEDTALQGVKGILTDIQAVVRPWGFRLEDIPVKVLLWHSRDDTSVPVRMGQILAQRIPQSEAIFFCEGGHFSLVKIIDAVLARLCSVLPTGEPPVPYHGPERA